jgi:hypothetical protein
LRLNTDIDITIFPESDLLVLIAKKVYKNAALSKSGEKRSTTLSRIGTSSRRELCKIKKPLG